MFRVSAIISLFSLVVVSKTTMFETVKGIYGEDSGLFNKSHPVYRE